MNGVINKISKLSWTKYLLVLAAIWGSLFVFIFVLNHQSIWLTKYVFWRLAATQQGTISVDETSLKIPRSYGGDGGDYCSQFTDLNGKTIPSVTYSGEHAYYCGCSPIIHGIKNVNYKLLKNTVVFQCGSEIYQTKMIPSSLITST